MQMTCVSAGSEGPGDAPALTVAAAHGIGPVAPAELARPRHRRRRPPARLGLGQRPRRRGGDARLFFAWLLRHIFPPRPAAIIGPPPAAAREGHMNYVRTMLLLAAM